MIKLTKLLMIASLMILPACSSNEEDEGQTEETAAEQTENQEPSEKQDTKESPEQNESSDADEGASEASDSPDEGLAIYRPEVGEDRVFKENGQQVFTEEIIAENDEYLQMLITLGGAQTTEIYRWTDDELTLVFQEYADPENPDSSVLEGFEPSVESEKILGDNADWELLSENETLGIDGQTYENVKIVKKVSDEVVGSETIAIRYYAPGYGLVKEEIEVTGENGYKSTVVLELK